MFLILDCSGEGSSAQDSFATKSNGQVDTSLDKCVLQFCSIFVSPVPGGSEEQPSVLSPEFRAETLEEDAGMGVAGLADMSMCN